MTKSGTSNLEPFDPKIERTFRRLRNLVRDKLSPRKQVKIEETPTLVVAIRAGAVGARNENITLMEYAQPSLNGIASCIRRPTIKTNNFELKAFYVQIIQNLV